MSEENRDSNTGQFTPSTDNTSGEDHANLKAGYVPLKEPGDEKVYTELEPQEAAERIAAMREEATPSGPESAIVTYSPMDELIGENTSLTNKQLSHLIADHRKSAEEQIEAAEIEATQKEVDELRGVDQEAEAAPEAAAQPAEPENDDAAIEKALKIPKLKAALTEVSERFTQSVNTANDFALASLGDYPEIMSLPPEQREGALVAMAQREPERFKQFMGSLNRVAQLQAAKQEQEQRAEQQRQGELQQYAKAESAKFEATIKDVPRAERAAIEQNIAEAITEYGGDLNQFLALMRSSEFASSTVQSLLWEVGKYRQIKKAAKPVPTRHVPQVQRPGTAGPRVSHSDVSVAEAKAAVQSDRSSKSLANLIGAMRRA
jgi:hypothetical protein